MQGAENKKKHLYVALYRKLKSTKGGIRMRLRKSIVPCFLFSILPALSSAAPAPSNGIAYPEGWQNWATIAVSHRTDNSTIRVILGNPIAVAAARSGTTNPWPDGSVLAKIVWKEKQLQSWLAGTTPGEFAHAEFMIKDTTKYAASHGWGWARWLGLEQTPFTQGPQSCISCHTPVKSHDWVFTEPAQFPQGK
jgi:hypothetical protein